MEKSIIWKCKSYDDLSKCELYQIITERIAVFIIEQNCPYQDCDNKDQHSLHLWCEINNEIVAYLRIVKAEVSYPEISIGRVLTTKELRTKGLGNILMAKGIEEVLLRFGKHPIRISAQTPWLLQ